MFDKNNGSNFAAHKEFNKALRGTCFVSIPYKTWMVVQLVLKFKISIAFLSLSLAEACIESNFLLWVDGEHAFMFYFNSSGYIKERCQCPGLPL